MSYDRIWVEYNEHSKQSTERFGLIAKSDRLYEQGHFVALSAGKNFCFDELFLFESAASATEFYESGFQKWESYIGDDNEGCGFQEVSLYRHGLRVAWKFYPPTIRDERRLDDAESGLSVPIQILREEKDRTCQLNGVIESPANVKNEEGEG